MQKSPPFFAQASNISVQFDRSDDFYLLWTEHQALPGNAAGELKLMKYDFSGNSRSRRLGFDTNGPTVVDAWNGESQVISPVLAVDSSVPTFSDSDSSGTTQSQSDPYSGNVYVSWETNDALPTGAQNFNPNQIVVVASSDGGQNFSGLQLMSTQGNFGAQRNVTPQIVVSQGSAPRAAGTNGPNDPGSPGVNPAAR